MILNLHNYRCFSTKTFEVPDTSFLIKDLNGTGKTTILSAIYAINTGKPWPGTKYSNFLKTGEQYFGISTELSDWFLSGKVTPSGRVTAKYSNPNKQSSTYLTYQPNDNYWLSQSRSTKLATLDNIISTTNSLHSENVSKLDKTTKSKLSFIKHYNLTGEKDLALLNFLNSTIIELSMLIWQSRLDFFQLLNNSIGQYNNLILNNLQNLSINWETTNSQGKKTKHKNLESIKSFDQILDKYNIDWDKLWLQESIAEKVLFGASRDDFTITTDYQEIQCILSRGEMRLFVLFVKQLGCDTSTTIWLLDDVFNELDDHREQLIMTKVFANSKQIIATGTRCHIVDIDIVGVN